MLKKQRRAVGFWILRNKDELKAAGLLSLLFLLYGIVGTIEYNDLIHTLN